MTLIITLCTLLLIAYLFDLTSAKTKIPSVILLMLLGWVLQQLTVHLGLSLPDLSAFLPVLGSIGLVLIVLEGSLELDMSKSKLSLIRKSFFGAAFSLIGISFLLALLFMYFGQNPFRESLINAIPFSIMSSAIAISSVRNLREKDKEFIISESSLSDILGVLFFNFIVINEVFDVNSFGQFGLKLLIIIAISFVATMGLLFLLSRIDHHIKFIPIILLVTLIYAIAEHFHLPALVIILVFGIFIGNIEKFRRFKFTERFFPEGLAAEIDKFNKLTMEATFMIRAVFFILFGFLMDTSQIFNPGLLIWSIAIMYLIYVIRTIQLKASKLPLKPLLLVAPRGLVTILLFLSISTEHRITLINETIITQVIILTTLLMMIGVVLGDRGNGKLGEEEAEEVGDKK